MWGSWLIYSIEYICTKDDTTKTGINIDTVKLSKLNPQNTFKDSESTHLNNCIDTGILLKTTSVKATKDNKVVIITHEHAMICDPFTPDFLPKNPEAIEPNRGKVIRVKYINILLLYFLSVYSKPLVYLNL